MADLTLGNPVVAIGWPEGEPGVNAPGESTAGCLEHPHLDNYSDPLTRARPRGGASRPAAVEDSYLVDSASSHMLVSKIKPCMSKYKQLYGETANGSLNQLSFI